jgi:putative peptidoglycan lipid II flippase
MTLAIPITSVLFQRGAFGYEEAVLTARALSAFAVGLWSVSMVRLIVPAFYAMEDTRTPVITAAGAFVANCCFSLILMGPVAASGDSRVADGIARLTQTLSLFNLRHAGLALSTSLAATVNLILLVVFLRRRLGELAGREVLPSFVRSLIAAVAMVPAVRFVAGLTDWSQRGQLLVHASVLLAAMSAGMLVFLLVALLLGGDEVQAVTRIVRRRLQPRATAAGAQP